VDEGNKGMKRSLCRYVVMLPDEGILPAVAAYAGMMRALRTLGIPCTLRTYNRLANERDPENICNETQTHRPCPSNPT
jgi:hypothetical protein